MKVINGDGLVLGRLASHAAKEALRGEDIIIVNSEKVVISGNKVDILAKYKQEIDRASRINPTRGPKFPKTPERLVKRTIRGMINHRSSRGKNALKKIKAYIGVPAQFSGKEETIDKIRGKSMKCDYITVGDLCNQLGHKGVF